MEDKYVTIEMIETLEQSLQSPDTSAVYLARNIVFNVIQDSKDYNDLLVILVNNPGFKIIRDYLKLLVEVFKILLSLPETKEGDVNLLKYLTHQIDNDIKLFKL